MEVFTSREEISDDTEVHVRQLGSPHSAPPRAVISSYRYEYEEQVTEKLQAAADEETVLETLNDLRSSLSPSLVHYICTDVFRIWGRSIGIDLVDSCVNLLHRCCALGSGQALGLLRSLLSSRTRVPDTHVATLHALMAIIWATGESLPSPSNTADKQAVRIGQKVFSHSSGMFGDLRAMDPRTASAATLMRTITELPSLAAFQMQLYSTEPSELEPKRGLRPMSARTFALYWHHAVLGCIKLLVDQDYSTTAGYVFGSLVQSLGLIETVEQMRTSQGLSVLTLRKLSAEVRMSFLAGIDVRYTGACIQTLLAADHNVKAALRNHVFTGLLSAQTSPSKTLLNTIRRTIVGDLIVRRPLPVTMTLYCVAVLRSVSHDEQFCASVDQIMDACSNPQFLERGDDEMHRSMTLALLGCLQLWIGPADLLARNLITAVSNHLNCGLDMFRLRGMLVAKEYAARFSVGANLDFDIPFNTHPDLQLLLDQATNLQSRSDAEGGSDESQILTVPRHPGDIGHSQSCAPRERVLADDEDDEDDDDTDDLPGFDISGDYDQNVEVNRTNADGTRRKKPTHLRACIKNLTQTEEPELIDEALDIVLQILNRTTIEQRRGQDQGKRKDLPGDEQLRSLVPRLTRAVMHAPGHYEYFVNFEARRMDALVTLGALYPKEFASYLSVEFYRDVHSSGLRLRLLRTLSATAQRLAELPNAEVQQAMITELDGTATTTPKGLLKAIYSDPTKTKYSSTKPSWHRQAEQEAKNRANKGNQLVEVSGYFLYDLLRGFDSTSHATLALLDRDTLVFTELMRTCSLLMHFVRHTHAAAPLARTYLDFLQALLSYSLAPVIKGSTTVLQAWLFGVLTALDSVLPEIALKDFATQLPGLQREAVNFADNHSDAEVQHLAVAHCCSTRAFAVRTLSFQSLADQLQQQQYYTGEQIEQQVKAPQGAPAESNRQQVQDFLHMRKEVINGMYKYYVNLLDSVKGPLFQENRKDLYQRMESRVQELKRMDEEELTVAEVPAGQFTLTTEKTLLNAYYQCIAVNALLQGQKVELKLAKSIQAMESMQAKGTDTVDLVDESCCGHVNCSVM
eukprot:Clim_evm20s134 gene=Clim_evmTU20s134